MSSKKTRRPYGEIRRNYNRALNSHIYKAKGNLYRFLDLYESKSNALEAAAYRRKSGYTVAVQRVEDGRYGVYYSRIQKVSTKSGNPSALTTKGRTSRSKLGFNIFGVEL